MPESAPSIDDPRRGPDAPHSPSRQRILVLGASGFIGRRIVRALDAGDWARPVAVRHRAAPDPSATVESLQFDATRPEAVRAALRDVSGVVNCVAGSDQAIVEGARALFDAAATLPVAPRIVHLSTMMVYGTTTGTADETSALKGDWDGYSAAKVEAERLARGYPNVVQLRPGIVYGPGSPLWSGRIGRWLLQRRLGDLGAAGSGICNLVHVADVVEAVERALRRPGIEGEAFNLSLSSPPTWNDYFRQLAAALRVPVVAIPPYRLLIEQYVLAPPLKIAERLAPSLPFAWRPPDPIRPWLPRLCAHALRLDVRKAESVLGMRWLPLATGLEQSARWVLDGPTAGAAA